MKQLCWNCKNTNKFKCEWFDDCSKFPNYVQTKYSDVTKYTYIIACQKYEPLDFKKFKTLTNKEIAKIFDISERRFYRHKKEYMKLFYKLTPPYPIDKINKC